MRSVSLTSSSYYYYYASGVCLGASQANSSPGPEVELKGHRPSTTHSGSPILVLTPGSRSGSEPRSPPPGLALAEAGPVSRGCRPQS